jgi:hypothetical protein
MGVQSHYKTLPASSSCRKVVAKQTTKKSKTDFFLSARFVFIAFLGGFSANGGRKHDQKNTPKYLVP